MRSIRIEFFLFLEFYKQSRIGTNRIAANAPVPKSKNSAKSPLSNRSALSLLCPFPLLSMSDVATTSCMFDRIPKAKKRIKHMKVYE